MTPSESARLKILERVNQALHESLAFERNRVKKLRKQRRELMDDLRQLQSPRLLPAKVIIPPKALLELTAE